MPDFTKSPQPVEERMRHGTPGRRPGTGSLLTLCVAAGILATGLGAAVSLLLPEGTGRTVTWVVVAVAVAGGLGLWQGLAPLSGPARLWSPAAARHHASRPERR